MLLNVFEPVMVKAPAPPWFNVQLNVDPPPTNVLAVAAVMEIMPVPVPAVVVNPVGAALLNAVVVAAGQTNVPPLNVRFFVPVAVVKEVPTVYVKPFKSNVPRVSVVATPVPVVSASCKVTEPLGVLIAIGCVNVFAELVIVCVVRPANESVPVPDRVIPVPFIQLPMTTKLFVLVANVIVFDVLNDISIVPMLYAALIVVVEPDAGYVAAGNTAVSCANGN